MGVRDRVEVAFRLCLDQMRIGIAAYNGQHLKCNFWFGWPV